MVGTQDPHNAMPFPFGATQGDIGEAVATGTQDTGGFTEMLDRILKENAAEQQQQQPLQPQQQQQQAPGGPAIPVMQQTPQYGWVQNGPGGAAAPQPPPPQQQQHTHQAGAHHNPRASASSVQQQQPYRFGGPLADVGNYQSGAAKQIRILVRGTGHQKATQPAMYFTVREGGGPLLMQLKLAISADPTFSDYDATQLRSKVGRDTYPFIATDDELRQEPMVYVAAKEQSQQEPRGRAGKANGSNHAASKRAAAKPTPPLSGNRFADQDTSPGGLWAAGGKIPRHLVALENTLPSYEEAHWRNEGRPDVFAKIKPRVKRLAVVLSLDNKDYTDDWTDQDLDSYVFDQMPLPKYRDLTNVIDNEITVELRKQPPNPSGNASAAGTVKRAPRQSAPVQTKEPIVLTDSESGDVSPPPRARPMARTSSAARASGGATAVTGAAPANDSRAGSGYMSVPSSTPVVATHRLTGGYTCPNTDIRFFRGEEVTAERESAARASREIYILVKSDREAEPTVKRPTVTKVYAWVPKALLQPLGEWRAAKKPRLPAPPEPVLGSDPSEYYNLVEAAAHPTTGDAE
ncbi:hypothetical protein PLESTB_000904400 [Pleodorina starrii]|uniref:Uncharacterized protein n=1 Tax=Pleodorina starrii TaxID=330485 RepID=A0A9W6BMM4_9CHLO|nr:hypothetical protein PLESTB_000904400 [Pleodorina starrii]